MPIYTVKLPNSIQRGYDRFLRNPEDLKARSSNTYSTNLSSEVADALVRGLKNSWDFEKQATPTLAKSSELRAASCCSGSPRSETPGLQFRRDLRAGRFTMEFAQSADNARQRISDLADETLILILSDSICPE